MAAPANPRDRAAIRAGLVVDIVQKHDQRTGRTVRGTVAEILTSSQFHPHGIKVRLADGRVGRVAGIPAAGGQGGPDSPA